LDLTGGSAIVSPSPFVVKERIPTQEREKDLAGQLSERRKRRNSPVNPVRQRERGLDLGKTFYEIHSLKVTRFISNGVKEEICPKGRG
jgi:hypothetical protein